MPLHDDCGQELEAGIAAPSIAASLKWRSPRIDFEQADLGMARDGERQAWIAQVAVDQQARAPRWASSEAKFLATVDLPSLGSAEMTPTTFGCCGRQRQIDRDLGRAQRLGEAATADGRSNSAAASWRLRSAWNGQARPSALSAHRRLDRLQQPEKFEAEFVAHMRRRRGRRGRDIRAARRDRRRPSRRAANDSARIARARGAEGARGGVAAVITRASVTGKDCCCSAS